MVVLELKAYGSVGFRVKDLRLEVWGSGLRL